MSVRFRYIGPDGEVEVATPDELIRRFISGELGGDTLLYDREEGGWAYARNHSLLLELRAPDFTAYTLTDPAPPSPEEVVASLLRDREASACEDAAVLSGLGPTRHGSWFGGATERSSVEGAEPQPAAPAVPRGPSAPRPATVDPSQVGQAGAPGTARKAASDLPMRSAGSRGMGRRAVYSAALVGLTSALFVLVLGGSESGPVPTALAPDAGDGVADLDPLDLPDRATPAGGPTELSDRELESFRDVVGEMEHLRTLHEVERVPPIWLEGVYLAGASRFSEVDAFWRRYRTYIEEMRGVEGELFRRSLLARLEADGLAGAPVSLQLARGLRTFEADAPRRGRVYTSLLELAAAAVDLHALLVEREGDITFEPAVSGISRDPVTEAVAENQPLQEQMNRLLDRIFIAMEEIYGERVSPREELPMALRRGLLPAQGRVLP